MEEQYTFLSEKWVERFREAVQQSAAYRKAAKTWEGDITLVILPDEKAGIGEPVNLHMDLWHGDCRGVKLISAEEARTSKYTITAAYDRWKQVAKEEIEPIKGMMQGKLKLKGNLAQMVRHVRAAKELVSCTTRIPTRFPEPRCPA